MYPVSRNELNWCLGRNFIHHQQNMASLTMKEFVARNLTNQFWHAQYRSPRQPRTNIPLCSLCVFTLLINKNTWYRKCTVKSPIFKFMLREHHATNPCNFFKNWLQIVTFQNGAESMTIVVKFGFSAVCWQNPNKLSDKPLNLAKNADLP